MYYYYNEGETIEERSDCSLCEEDVRRHKNTGGKQS